MAFWFMCGSRTHGWEHLHLYCDGLKYLDSYSLDLCIGWHMGIGIGCWTLVESVVNTYQIVYQVRFLYVRQ
jgi:hypothetical protein